MSPTILRLLIGESLSYARPESLSSVWSLRIVACLNLCPWRTWSSSSSEAPPPLCGWSLPCAILMRCWPPSTGKSQVLLCAATFKFRGHLSIVFSWSLAFSRPKNGPDRTAGRSRTAETVFHRSLTHAASRRRRHQVSEGAPSPPCAGSSLGHAPIALLALVFDPRPPSPHCPPPVHPWTKVDSTLSMLWPVSERLARVARTQVGNAIDLSKSLART